MGSIFNLIQLIPAEELPVRLMWESMWESIIQNRIELGGVSISAEELLIE